MATALEGGYDLAAIAALLVALAVLYMVKDLVAAVAHLFDFSLLGYRPLHGIAAKLENGVIGALDGVIKGVERLVARFASGLVDAFGMLIAIPLLLGLGIKAALEYLWSAALKPLIHAIADPIRDLATRGVAKAAAVAADLVSEAARLERYARAQAASALHDAEAYVTSKIRSELTTIGGDIDAAVARAERYADTAVSKLRAAEESAIANAAHLAAEAKAAGEAAGRAVLATAEAEIGAGLLAEAARRAAELAQLDTLTKAALSKVESIAVTAEDEIGDILGNLDARTAAELIASIPLIATLVHAIATEAGLENAECRSKVKGVCGTSPSSWGNLLAGLAVLGVAFNLEELYRVARPLVGGLADVIREAA